MMRLLGGIIMVMGVFWTLACGGCTMMGWSMGQGNVESSMLLAALPGLLTLGGVGAVVVGFLIMIGKIK